MKTLFISLLLFFSFFGLYAQRFHAIIFADTQDKHIGASCFHDYERMSIEFATMAYANNMELKSYFYREADFTKLKLFEVLKDLQVNKQDIVFFYYSGHGARASNDISHFPQLAVGKVATDYIALEQIDEILKAKNPKLRVLIADCCNETIADLPAQITANQTATELKDAEVNTYQSLLKNVQGSIVLSSSSKGELSMALPEGGVFTLCLLQELQSIVIKNSDTNWGELLNNTRDLVQKYVESATNGKHKQTAQYAINVTPIDKLSAEPIAVVHDEAHVSLNNELLYAFMAIADARKKDSQRIEMIPALLKKYFASDEARIEFIGKNGITLVDRMPAKRFVNHLASTGRLAQLVILDAQTDTNGKVTSLRLHEIYRF